MDAEECRRLDERIFAGAGGEAGRALVARLRQRDAERVIGAACRQLGRRCWRRQQPGGRRRWRWWRRRGLAVFRRRAHRQHCVIGAFVEFRREYRTVQPDKSRGGDAAGNTTGARAVGRASTNSSTVACADTGTYACAYACADACAHTCAYARANTCAYARANTCAYARAHTCAYARAHTCAYARANTCAYARANTGADAGAFGSDPMDRDHGDGQPHRVE